MITYTFKKGSEAAMNIRSFPYKFGGQAKTCSVYVDHCSGLIGKPSLKSVQKSDWQYLHGSTPDLRNLRYTDKTIELSCWMKSESKQQLVEQIDKFFRYFNYDDMILMKVTWDTDNDNGGMEHNPHESKGIFALLWLKETKITPPKWHKGVNYARFTLTFEDPYPVKRVYKYTGTDGSGVIYDIISDTEIDIFTDNGDRIYDVLTGQGRISCPLQSYILVCGDIDHAKSNEYYSEQADPEVPIDPADPSTYVITEYKLVYPVDREDEVKTIYDEI